MTAIHKRELPDGYTLDRNEAIWNVGHIFRWSEAFQCFLHETHCTVKPGQTLYDAFTQRCPDLLFTKDYEIFFVDR